MTNATHSVWFGLNNLNRVKCLTAASCQSSGSLKWIDNRPFLATEADVVFDNLNPELRICSAFDPQTQKATDMSCLAFFHPLCQINADGNKKITIVITFLNSIIIIISTSYSFKTYLLF